MRIVFDLDGVICPIKRPDQSYADLEPLPEARQRLHELRKAGHTIIIHTARNMATYDGNLGKIMKNMGKLTLDWLEKYAIEYDEIYFGKPNAQVYIDDRGLHFVSWESLTDETLERAASER